VFWTGGGGAQNISIIFVWAKNYRSRAAARNVHWKKSLKQQRSSIRERKPQLLEARGPGGKNLNAW